MQTFRGEHRRRRRRRRQQRRLWRPKRRAPSSACVTFRARPLPPPPGRVPPHRSRVSRARAASRSLVLVEGAQFARPPPLEACRVCLAAKILTLRRGCAILSAGAKIEVAARLGSRRRVSCARPPRSNSICAPSTFARTRSHFVSLARLELVSTRPLVECPAPGTLRRLSEYY